MKVLFATDGLHWNTSLDDIFIQSNANTITNNFAGDITDGGASNTVASNSASDPQFVNAAGADFSLVVGSPAIDACADVGLPFNGSAPDCGRWESVGTGNPTVGGFSAANIVTATPNVVNLIFQSTVDPITACAFADFTVNVATVNRGSTGINLTGASTAAITFDGAAVTSGQTVTLAYSGTSCKAGALTVNPWTAQSVSNQVDAPAGFTFPNLVFRIRGVREAENAPTWKVAANTNYTTFPGGIVRLRYLLTCASGPCAPVPIDLIRAIDGGAYSAVNDGADELSSCSSSVVCMYRNSSDTTMPVDGASTTQLLGSGTLVGGQVKRKNNVLYTTPTMATAEEVEMEYIVKVQETAVVGTTLDFNVRNDSTGVALCASGCNIPRITVVTPSAGVGP